MLKAKTNLFLSQKTVKRNTTTTTMSTDLAEGYFSTELLFSAVFIYFGYVFLFHRTLLTFFLFLSPRPAHTQSASATKTPPSLYTLRVCMPEQQQKYFISFGMRTPITILMGVAIYYVHSLSLVGLGIICYLLHAKENFLYSLFFSV